MECQEERPDPIGFTIGFNNVRLRQMNNFYVAPFIFQIFSYQATVALLRSVFAAQ